MKKIIFVLMMFFAAVSCTTVQREKLDRITPKKLFGAVIVGVSTVYIGTQLIREYWYGVR